MPVILDTQEAEIRRIKVRNQPGEIAPRDCISKNYFTNRASGVDLSSSPSTKKKKERKWFIIG